MSIKTVTVNKNTVIKTNDPIRLGAEAEKTIRAFNVGKESGLFCVPRVLDYDSSKGILVLERLRNIRQLRSVLCGGWEGKSLVETIKTIGSSLAVIHSNMHIPEEMHVALPPELSFRGSDVVLHGDMSTKNIFITTDRPGIAILDWQMTLVHGGDATYGTRYFDAMWFTSNLIRLLSRLDHNHNHGKHAVPMAKMFIESYVESYFHNTNIMKNDDEIVSYMKQFFSYKIPKWKRDSNWIECMLYLPTYSRIKELINSYHA